MVAQQRRTNTEKRHGRHQKQNRHFLKVYSPYLPLIVFTVLILVFSFSKPPVHKTSVLSYATNVSATDLLVQTNKQRQASKIGSLAINAELAKAAQAKAEDMVARNYWSHIAPDGQQPWSFINQTGYQYTKAGENLAYGFDDSASAVSGWMNSPSHKANILDGTFKEVGFGIASSKNYQESGPETIIVALYATPEIVPAGKSNSVRAFNSNSQNQEPASRTIAKIQTLTEGKAPWIMTVVGFLIGISVALLIVKHGVALRRAFKNGEKFVMRHVVFDLSVLSFIVLCLIISRTAGIVR